jgi:hypothetical protein
MASSTTSQRSVSRWSRVLLGAALLVVTACSGTVERPTSVDATPPPMPATPTTNSDSTIAELGDLFGAQFQTEPGSNPTPYEFTFTEANASCVGRSVVEALFDTYDSETLMEANVTVEGFESGIADMSFVSNDEIDLYLLDGFVACTDMLEVLAAELSGNTGWSEASTSCYFGALMANDESRQALAWSAFTIGNMNQLLDRVDAAIVWDDLIFGCLSDIEIGSLIVPVFASDLGISDESTLCLIGGLLSHADARDALRSLVNVAEVPELMQQLGNDPVVGETTNDLIDTCLTDDEKVAVRAA